MLAGAVFLWNIFWMERPRQNSEASNNLDLPVIMGSVIVIATTFVVINILVDLIYAYLDPKNSLD
jgi:peptide/nickel transport system permease protein